MGIMVACLRAGLFLSLRVHLRGAIRIFVVSVVCLFDKKEATALLLVFDWPTRQEFLWVAAWREKSQDKSSP